MMPGMNPKQIEKMMKKLNMNVVQIDAEKVTIETKQKKILIKNPEVMVTNMMGRDVYQISGDVFESMTTSEEDIKMVMDQTGKDRNTVVRKLEELDHDLAKAIIELQEEEKE